MDVAIKAKWIEALRSGKYKQCRHRLRADRGHCCIGVGYDLIVPNFVEDPGTQSAAHAIGLTDEMWPALVDMNDFDEKTFAEIADHIEWNL